jgi:predicted AAA+ superfamily ATPase
MIKRQDLEIKNPWWNNNEFIVPEKNLPKRDLFFVLEKNLHHSLMLNIVGLRRVGKSTIQKQLIDHLLANNKIHPNNIFYFLFDYSFQLQKPEFLDDVLFFYFKEIADKPSLNFEDVLIICLFPLKVMQSELQLSQCLFR